MQPSLPGHPQGWPKLFLSHLGKARRKPDSKELDKKAFPVLNLKGEHQRKEKENMSTTSSNPQSQQRAALSEFEGEQPQCKPECHHCGRLNPGTEHRENGKTGKWVTCCIEHELPHGPRTEQDRLELSQEAAQGGGTLW